MITCSCWDTGGDALVYGEALSAAGGMERIRANMGVCPQFDILWHELTGSEHMLLYGAIKVRCPAGRSPQSPVPALCWTTHGMPCQIGLHCCGSGSIVCATSMLAMGNVCGSIVGHAVASRLQIFLMLTPCWRPVNC